jgi:2-iminoacetate synthase
VFVRNLQEYVSLASGIGTRAAASKNRLISLLEKSLTPQGLGSGELIELLNATLPEGHQELVKDFAAQVRRPHRQDILLLPPLYFSSPCENKCLYCDFSSKGTRLTATEFVREMKALLDLGYRSIELVSSQDPTLFPKKAGYSPERQVFEVGKVVDYFESAAAELKKRGGGMLTSNIPPLDVASLRTLKAAGLDCFLLWVETFHPVQYRKLHPTRGPKSNQAFRLRSYEAARAAGIPHVAGAFLKGLYDWRQEEFLLYELDRHLRKTTGCGFSIIGTPRLKGPFAQTRLVSQYRVSDSDYELNIALDRILFDGVIWLQTRESPALNNHLLDRYGAGLILTLECSTAPGGYSHRSKRKSQFPVFHQNLRQAVARLEERGYKVIFDWTAETLSSFQRKRRTVGQA